MKKVGVVINQEDGSVILRVARGTSCGGSCSKCGSSCSDKSKIEVKVENSLDAGVGDVVELESASTVVLGTAFLFYILPILALILGMYLSNTYWIDKNQQNGEVLSLIVGFGFMIVTFLGIHIFGKFRSKGNNNMFTMTKLIGKGKI